jgi:hypothetical protein
MIIRRSERQPKSPSDAHLRGRDSQPSFAQIMARARACLSPNDAARYRAGAYSC